jgi:hypothetical protein
LPANEALDKIEYEDIGKLILLGLKKRKELINKENRKKIMDVSKYQAFAVEDKFGDFKT